MNIVTIIVAYSKNRVIGLKNSLPWNLPNDLKNFKKITFGHHVIMGRKTWGSLEAPLIGRRNLVLSKKKDFKSQNLEVFNNLESALSSCPENNKIFIIGGSEIYQLALPIANHILATEIHSIIEGDSYFSDFSLKEWEEIYRHPQPVENGLQYDFVLYSRKKKYKKIS